MKTPDWFDPLFAQKVRSAAICAIQDKHIPFYRPTWDDLLRAELVVQRCLMACVKERAAPSAETISEIVMREVRAEF